MRRARRSENQRAEWMSNRLKELWGKRLGSDKDTTHRLERHVEAPADIQERLRGTPYEG